MSDLFSNDPKALKKMADETIAHLKVELAKFDATQAPHYERLMAYATEARDDHDGERYEDFSREADRYRARWAQARQPFIQEIYHIAMAKDALEPRTITFVSAQEIGEGIRIV